MRKSAFADRVRERGQMQRSEWSRATPCVSNQYAFTIVKLSSGRFYFLQKFKFKLIIIFLGKLETISSIKH